MTKEESDNIEELILLWYQWADRYRPNLGAPKTSLYSKKAISSNVYSDTNEVDERLNSMLAEQIEVCIDELCWQWRSVIGIHAANKATRTKIFRNPRMTNEQHQTEYQKAKEQLLISFQKRGLI